MEEKSRSRYAVYNLIASGGGYFINILISFICRKVFVMFLPIEYLGLNGLFTNILSMLSLAELGIGSAITYELYKPILEKDYKKVSSLMLFYKKSYAAIGVLVGILGILLIPFLGYIVQSPQGVHENINFLYILFLFNVIVSYFFSYKSTLLIANQENYLVVTINYVTVVIQNIFQIISLWIFKNYIIYLLVQIFFSIITNIIISRKAEKKYPYCFSSDCEPLTKSELKKIIINVKALTVTKLSGILVNNTDNIVITFFNGLEVGGIVSNYTLITGMLSSLINQLFSSLTATVGNINAEENHTKSFFIFKTLTLLNYWIYSISTIGIIFVSTDLISFIFGKQYVIHFSIPVILAINFYMLGMQNIVGIYKSTMGLFKYGQYILLITAILNLIGDFILGYKFGIFGVFLATAIARMMTNTFYEPYIIYKYGFNIKFKKYVITYIIYAVLMVISSIFMYFLCKIINVNLFINILLKLILCITIHTSLIVLIYHQTDEYKYVVSILYMILKNIYKKVCFLKKI